MIDLIDYKDVSFGDYKKPAMYLALPHCTFKCGKEHCQNYHLRDVPPIRISIDILIEQFLSMSVTEAIVFGGLEPLDSWEQVKHFISELRYKSNADIVIYTGYEKEEIPAEIINWLIKISIDGPIIIKYGRFIPNQKHHFDEILGVELASPNQWAEDLHENYNKL